MKIIDSRKNPSYGLFMPKKNEVQIVISGVPADLMKKIDELARVEDRNRSSYVRKLLGEIVGQKLAEHPQAA